ncbi:MAG: hypothetical protein B7Z65_00305 [Ferrovum sp. 21-44-67]|jgi:uncharacterized protein with NRDE domain|uniref:NRDE family protein n=1 Tax=Ferrovum sp. JA12 TaxID=1356299 RepID=UPI000703834F|nr:NRDE family protein [Ferrovum sp. JA12]KRH79819.1 hypothetical protein FERRO_08950 [Ferrovum sp. JA12]OYV80672.1 MAG: hypothetical protein B7Z65_00305 [Ferrovum sp. 21-44-67]HQU05936.1 NRDE family protein [Ferrovaceae bacterium]
MCLILVAWQQHPYFPLIILSNRDEFYQRPSQIPRFWADYQSVYGGRDLQAEGTWLGVNRFKRLAAVTNYRDPSRLKTDVKSRGQLTANFLCHSQPINEYLTDLTHHLDRFNDFNLLLYDHQELTCFESKSKTIHSLDPGIYGLSNHFLDTPWPKVTVGKEQLSHTLKTWAKDIRTLEDLHDDTQCLTVLSDILSNDAIYADSSLPSTGLSLELERRLSAAFIKSDDYGTRASSIVIGNQDGDFLFFEKQYGMNGIFEGDTSAIVYHLEHNHD